MKKLAAISLICLLAFNWYGYRIVTDILTSEADQQLESRLDNQEYDESQLIEVSIALNVPYQNNQTEFERHYGEVEVDGVFYTYVKSKVENGSLVLKCIPNESKKQLRNAGNDYYKKTNGLDQDQSGRKTTTSVAKQSTGDYDDQLETFTIKVPVEMTSHLYARYASVLPIAVTDVACQPPQI